MSIAGVVVVHEPDGKVKLRQAMSPTAAGAAGGAVWGGLIGLLFLAPVVGMAVGAASGALGGKMADVGINDDFLKTLGEKLTPGSAALIVLTQSNAPDKVLERVAKYGGEVAYAPGYAPASATDTSGGTTTTG